MEEGGSPEERKRQIKFEEVVDNGVHPNELKRQRKIKETMVNGGYPEELKREGETALLLATLKHTIFDKKTASTLDKLKSNVVGGGTCRQVTRSRKHQIVPRKEEGTTTNAAKYKPLGNIPQLPEELINKLIEDYRPPDIPQVPGLNGLIGNCSKPFEKQLTESDVRDDQSRLSMKKNDVERCLMPLLNEKDDLAKGINVTTYNSKGQEFKMVFKSWNSKIHVLTGGWKAFFHEHQLKKYQDFVTVWMFRKLDTGVLCFVITWRRLPVFEPLGRKRQQNLINGWTCGES